MDPVANIRLLGRTESVHDLFLQLYEFVATGNAVDDVRRMFTGTTQDVRWQNLTHPAARAITARIGRAQPLDWRLNFATHRHDLCQVLLESSFKLHPQDVLGAYVFTLKLLDPIVGEVLKSGAHRTHPVVPAPDRYTLVYRPPRYFPRYRDEIDAPGPSAFQHDTFQQALHLHSVYVVPPEDPDTFIAWRVERLPSSVDHVLESQKVPRIVSLSFPHDTERVEVHIDEARRRFHVTFDPSPSLVDEVIAFVEEEIEHGAAIVLLPELTGAPAVTTRIAAALRRKPYRLALVLPGSRHEMGPSGRHWNRVTALDSAGAEVATCDKVAAYPLPAQYLEHKGYHQLAVDARHGKETLEDLATGPRRLTLFESARLGRILIVICRDILEPPVQTFCRKHRPDHIFVLAKSPSLADFRNVCTQLGREIDAAIHVANDRGCPAHAAAFTYVPLRKRFYLGSARRVAHAVCRSSVVFGRKGVVAKCDTRGLFGP